ncbi:MAG TPA: hypothetical protein DD727_08980 [Clostridiales bacterium]|nr:hypothetical protein [Clostridiales bacterium]
MAEKRPNLVFVFADQLRRCSLGYAGDKLAYTPNIDSLASQSLDFYNCVSGHPVCSAYRASLLTGKYTTSTGMVINEIRLNPDHHPDTFAHVLRRNGYETDYIGKWHMYANQFGYHDKPENSFIPPGKHRLGFDGYFAAYNFHHQYYGGYYHLDTPEKIPMLGYEPDRLTDLCLNRIDHWVDAAQKGNDQPFAIFLSLPTPHDPWRPKDAPPELLEQFKDIEFPTPDNYSDTLDSHGDQWSNKQKSPEQIRSWMRVYYAMVANIDENVGRIVKKLRECGIDENTILVFSSDHGEMFGAHGRMKKNIFYDEAVRIPFLVCYPGVFPEGSLCDVCLNTVDMMPTLLGLAGIEVPAAAEGMDVSRKARFGEGPEPLFAFMQNTGACAIWEDGHEWRAVRDKRYTYAIYRSDRQELMFDNIKDPRQKYNLIGDPDALEAADRLRRGMREIMERLKDKFEISSYYRDHWVSPDRRILRTATSEVRYT